MDFFPSHKAQKVETTCRGDASSTWRCPVA
uniref:Uncharacterized protein n=1 Tax=Arundo donax TaxID=35708 RepID=A0A0A9F1A1_ARUDO